MAQELGIYPHVAFLIVVLTGVVLVNAKISLKEPPQTTKLKIGQNASLACRSTLSSEVDCHWLRNGQPVAIGRGMWKNKYDWQGRPTRGDCSVRLISSDLEHHGGTWQCSVTDLNSLDNVVSSAVQVYLLVEPHEMKVEVTGSGMWVGLLHITDGRVTVQEGINITANCSVCCGSPNATITWKKVTATRSVSLSSVRKNTMQTNFTWLSEAVIDMMVTRRDNKVTLNCFAYHDTFRSRKNMQFVLDVHYPPLNLERPKNITGYLGDTVLLECPLYSNPAPKYRWYFRPDENSTWQTLPETGGVLTLKDANENSTGVYNCTATARIVERNYFASGLLNLTVIEGAFLALKSTEAIILGAVLGFILLAAIIGIIVFIKKRRSVHGGYGRTYVSANDKESPPEGPTDPVSGSGADGDTPLNQMAWNAEATQKEGTADVVGHDPSSAQELVYAELSHMNPGNGRCVTNGNKPSHHQTIYAQLKF